MADFVLEPKVGGRWYEVGVDGKECETGRVTHFEPPDGLTLAWHLNERWQYDPDPAHASEVEVRFVAEGPTRVEWPSTSERTASPLGKSSGVQASTGAALATLSMALPVGTVVV